MDLSQARECLPGGLFTDGQILVVRLALLLKRSQCHTGASPAFGLDWSSTANTCANVGRPSVQIPTLNEITAGNPATSYVIWKVEGQGPLGEPIAPQTVRMPMANPALAPETIQNMKDWIADGVPGC